MNTLAWIVQRLCGVVFFAHGIALLAKPTAMREQFVALPYARSFLSFIGVCAVLGGLGLLLPLWTGSAPWLTPLAAVGLASIMAGAVWTHLQAKEGPQIGVPPLITLLLVLVVVVRWPLFGGLS